MGSFRVLQPCDLKPPFVSLDDTAIRNLTNETKERLSFIEHVFCHWSMINAEFIGFSLQNLYLIYQCDGGTFFVVKCPPPFTGIYVNKRRILSFIVRSFLRPLSPGPPHHQENQTKNNLAITLIIFISGRDELTDAKIVHSFLILPSPVVFCCDSEERQ